MRQVTRRVEHTIGLSQKWNMFTLGTGEPLISGRTVIFVFGQGELGKEGTEGEGGEAAAAAGEGGEAPTYEVDLATLAERTYDTAHDFRQVSPIRHHSGIGMLGIGMLCPTGFALSHPSLDLLNPHHLLEPSHWFGLFLVL